MKSQTKFASNFLELEESGTKNRDQINDLVEAVEKFGEVKNQLAIAKLISAEQKKIKD